MKNLFSRQFFTLAVATVIGNSLLLLFFTQNPTNDLLGFLSAAAVALLLGLIFKFLKGYLVRYKIFGAKTVATAAFILASTALLLIFIQTILNLSGYVAGVILKGQNTALPFVVFAFLSVWLGFLGAQKLLKFSLLVFPLLAALLVLMFAFSAPFAQIKYLLPYKSPTPFGFFSAFWHYLLVFLSSLLPLLLFSKKGKKPPVLTSFLAGVLFILLAKINTLLVFGSEFSATLSVPYSFAVSAAAMGQVFSRLDIFLYIVCFFCGLLKQNLQKYYNKN